MDENPTYEELERRLGDLCPGDHMCCIYETEEEHRALFTPFLRHGLEKGEKVLYVVDTHKAEEVIQYLRDDRVEIEPFLASGQLVILTIYEAYMREESFNPDSMIALLRDETQRSLSEGYPAMRVTGEMTWALKGLRGSDRLIEYEAKLNDFFPVNKCLAICQYDRRRFESSLLLDVLATHPIVIIGTEVFDNFYYMPPKDFFGPNPETSRLDTWLGSLTYRKRAEKALHQSNEELEQKVKERSAELIETNKKLERQIEERKQAEQALLQSEERYRTLVEESPLGISIIGKDNVYKYINPKFTDLFGYTLEDIPIGIEWFKKAFPDEKYRKEVISEWITVSTKLDSNTVPPRDFIVTCKDGSKKDIQFFSVKIESGDYFFIYQDLTEQKKLEARYLQAQKMEAIGTLTSGIAHDFNNLLTVIIGTADILLMTLGKNNSLRKDIDEIRSAGNKATALTSQLLAFSRKQIIQPKVLDINEVLKGLEKMIGRLIREDIEIKMLLCSEPCRIKVDRTHMEQVIINLLLNARDAMPGGGKLNIETRIEELGEEYFYNHGLKGDPGRFVLLSVTDTGIGMDEDTQSRIFEPFFTTKDRGEGTGLGLASVYGIVKQHNGFIWVYSEPRQGTAFKIYLPKVVGDVEVIKDKEVSRKKLIGSETILVVEDDDMVLNLIRKALKGHGYQMLEAQNGQQALQIVEEYEGNIHVAVTDVVMPKMSGRELAKNLQALSPEIKVIFMSGYSDNSITRHGILEKCIKFIQKPFTPTSLLLKLREVLDGK